MSCYKHFSRIYVINDKLVQAEKGGASEITCRNFIVIEVTHRARVLFAMRWRPFAVRKKKTDNIAVSRSKDDNIHDELFTYRVTNQALR